jgi:phosphoenolpyruvate carboxylase
MCNHITSGSQWAIGTPCFIVNAMSELAKELTILVDWSVTELGHLIESELGAKGFARVEKIRRFVKSSEGQTLDGLMDLKKELHQLSDQECYQIAHSFSLMLELINSCEAAYRTSRLKSDLKSAPVSESATYGRVIHVLTAHPTESRNPDIIFYFKKIQALFERRLESAQDNDVVELRGLLRWVWRLPMSKQRKPSVMDEAEYIYSLVLEKEIIDIFIQQRLHKQPFYIRTWVGGDKDGHPGVDEKTMLGSLQMSRNLLLKWLREKLQNYLENIQPLKNAIGSDKSKIRKLLAQSQDIKSHIKRINRIEHGDAQKVHHLHTALDALAKTYKTIFAGDSGELYQIRLLMKVFPGLVVPLELREASELVHEALKIPKKNSAIARMLDKLSKISPQHDPRFYVRGFILSQTEGARDIIAGMSLVEKYMGKARLPVVPLFESSHSLANAVEIVEELLKNPRRRSVIQKNWSAKFEVMLGYSDSSKENGAFPSRFLISQAICNLEQVIQDAKLVPIFFHGSGGSIERGGGSIQEQTDWWPQSALATVKMTIQGEMIYRNYSAAEILSSQLERLVQARNQKNGAGACDSGTTHNELLKFSDFVQHSYQQILKDPDFLTIIEKATPYSFLKTLRLGSRPSKRQGAVDIKSLRAIPWVLCWTQTRILFPTWWGVGSFWQTLDKNEKKRYREVLEQSSVFRSYIKALGFTLAKIEMPVFALYLKSSELDSEIADKFIELFKTEHELSLQALREITGEQDLLWYRPWLGTSIGLRSPLIHPLNVLQLIALQKKDVLLLRETVTGIASGMLTTG